MLTMIPPKPLRHARALYRFRVLASLLMLTAVPVRADWPNTNATKYVQFPDPTTNGFDILAAQATPTSQPLVLADDFQCTRTGPITDIHIWASWLGDTQNCNLPITLAIWNDVPAVAPNFSHPGTIMYWSQTFLPGQYTVKAVKTANEQFWNPEGGILGSDHLIWQYNFYPTQPFVQQGSATAPRVYWLSMTAGFNVQPFGWKTATNHWNDDAVYGHLLPGGLPQGDWQELRDPRSAANPRSLDLAFALTTTQIITNPPPATNKWLQLPDLQNGLDVRATFPKILADDFLCTAAGTLTNIQIWASTFNNITPDPNTRFVLGIWDDVPAGSVSGTATNFSHPGKLLWTETFTPGMPTFAGTANEMFYDPNTGSLTPENQIWKYNFNPKRPFCQKGSTNNHVVYWLSVWAQSANPNFLVGWKTSTNHWNDDAVFGHVNAAGSPVGDWKDLHDPQIGNTHGISLDLAFLINNGPPSADCDPNLNPKYVQWPDPSLNGLDVKATVPKILADDFPCKRVSRINGITVWGSWKDDNLDPNTTFQLGLWSDAKAITNADGSIIPSHPYQLLCTETFYPPTTIGTAPMRYKYSLAVSNVLEQFYDPNIPGTGGLIGSDTQIWRYDFYPRLPCWRQDGSPNTNKVYWLSVTATNANPNQFLFGWKTSTNHWNDDGVYGHVGPTGPVGDWKELRDPRTSNSLDLSFAIRTFPVVSVNKDLWNRMPQTPAYGLRIVVAGHHEITSHYDDAPPWPIFHSYTAGGNTVVEWSGRIIPPNQMTHIGFEMGGTAVSFVSMNWLDPIGAIIGKPIQLNPNVWGNGTVLTLRNDLNAGEVIVGNAQLELYADPEPLERMVMSANRQPLAIVPLPLDQTPIAPGCVRRIATPMPQGLPQARYGLLVLPLYDALGQPATMDFLQLPLPMETQPVIERAALMDSFFDVFFSPDPNRTYRFQYSPNLGMVESFFDVFTEISFPDGTMPDGGAPGVMIPVSGPQGFYRIVQDPE